MIPLPQGLRWVRMDLLIGSCDCECQLFDRGDLVLGEKMCGTLSTLRYYKLISKPPHDCYFLVVTNLESGCLGVLVPSSASISPQIISAGACGCLSCRWGASSPLQLQFLRRPLLYCLQSTDTFFPWAYYIRYHILCDRMEVTLFRHPIRQPKSSRDPRYDVPACQERYCSCGHEEFCLECVAEFP